MIFFDFNQFGISGSILFNATLIPYFILNLLRHFELKENCCETINYIHKIENDIFKKNFATSGYEIRL